MAFLYSTKTLHDLTAGAVAAPIGDAILVPVPPPEADLPLLTVIQTVSTV